LAPGILLFDTRREFVGYRSGIYGVQLRSEVKD